LRYVGETNNLARRRGEHVRSNKLREGADTFEWKLSLPETTSAQRRDAERQHINKHSPPENRRRGGGGRPPIEPR
jgi:hypothetical protein